MANSDREKSGKPKAEKEVEQVTKKAKMEAKEIVKKARTEAKEIKSKARVEAQEVRANARKQVKEIKKKKEEKEKEVKERKVKFLHTRVPEKLEKKIKHKAEQMRIPTSLLIRNILENAFK